MARHAILTAVAGLLVALAAVPAEATHPELACGHFALTEPLVLPREALVLRTVSPGVNEVVLNGECVSRRVRVRHRREGGVRFVAIFGQCGLARGVKVRGRSDRTCGALRGRLIVRRPRFRSSFDAVAVSEHECGADGICGPGSFCELPPGICAADHLAGTCVRLPGVCPDVFEPVCGCDGVTYGNDCERRATGVSKSHDGPCDTAGCFENAECADTEYCAKRPGECRAAGECRRRPVPCPLFFQPVCGCDGNTYGNACEAGNAGVNVAHDGACEQHCGTIAGLPCPDGSVCDLESGMCGTTDLGGVCIPKPEACPNIYAPVCGCDGVTYGNDCERVAAGAQKARDGTCQCVPILCPPDTVPIDTDHDGCDDDCLSARCETNDDCPDDRWCANFFGFGDCAEPGWCQERPLGCPDVWLPVCGCNGETYSNECDAAAAGVRIAHEGTCLCEPPICPDGQPPVDTNGDACPDRCPPARCGTIAGLGCPDGMVCDLEPGSCQVSDAAGTCVATPEVCPELYFPVCGCDGVTYGNDCERIAAGATKLRDGECKCTGVCCPPWLEPFDSTDDGCPDTCASTVIPCVVICDVDGCRPDCPLPDACETACDCYVKFGTSFCDDCPLLCPSCGDYWQCEAGRCVEACGPLPPGGIPCLADAPTG